MAEKKRFTYAQVYTPTMKGFYRIWKDGADLTVNEKSFVSALRLITETDEYKNYQNAVRKTKLYERNHNIKSKKQPSLKINMVRSDTERTQ